jgi:hypothetical protein
VRSPFGTSLRRNPEDPRNLGERLDAVIVERLEEAADFVCLDLMIQLRRRHGRPLPEAASEKDREEFKGLVREFLRYLHQAFPCPLSEADRQQVSQAEARAGGEETRRLVAVQVWLARQLPDYWQRFEVVRADFARERLSALPAKPGFLSQLFGRHW